ncbi:beta-N-acetylhexosaminidase [Actinoplanes derwentensis]|uniref:beta-N-acetylhexosaminidase n=2 Tax=Actinoplanes derwentensis TaxID=113562 RepID=A0A1H2DA20_9ACTN|nr:beta-N-acetylhexosaminidase [Actinoplanes derwentensis]SDT79580.1 hexosaminidase [Actinoplanes derwentensis]
MTPGPVPPGAEVRTRVDPTLAAEGYVLSCGPAGIDLAGGSEAGVFYGRQTLRQLGPDVPGVHIEDAPRFTWRGVMLDVARHFMPVPDVLRFVDLIAFHKLNVLHLHLTDDQGWRIEVPGWPRLTTVGAWRSSTMLGSRVHDLHDGEPHGGFYTTADLRQIVEYAARRHVTVVPEVDMPGHMQAAVAAYPALGNGFDGPVRTGWGISSHVLNLSEATFDFCRRVLDHVCDIFPSEFIGIGGDECPTVEWPGGRELQADFTARMASHLATRGRRVYGWDEILAGGAPDGAVIAAWRGVEPADVAIRAGHQVVCCPDVKLYLDYRQSDDPGEPTPVGTLLTLEDVYTYEPPSSPLVLGAQANIWTEHMESRSRVEYMAFPRLCALAEVVWGPAERDFGDFTARLPAHLARLGALGVNYRPLSGPRPADARPSAPGNPRTLADRLAELHEMTADLR